MGISALLALAYSNYLYIEHLPNPSDYFSPTVLKWKKRKLLIFYHFLDALPFPFLIFPFLFYFFLFIELIGMILVDKII